MSLRIEEAPQNSLKNATLRDFYKECTKDGPRRILNVLDLPMGAAELPPIPQFMLRGLYYYQYSIIWHHCSHLASNITAWQQLLGTPGLIDVDPPLNDVKWGITGGQNALSWPHVDANGLATAVTVTTGAKYWVVMKERRNLGVEPKLGNLGSMHAFPKSWHPSNFQKGLHEYEAVHLAAGTTLWVLIL